MELALISTKLVFSLFQMDNLSVFLSEQRRKAEEYLYHNINNDVRIPRDRPMTEHDLEREDEGHENEWEKDRRDRERERDRDRSRDRIRDRDRDRERDDDDRRMKHRSKERERRRDRDRERDRERSRSPRRNREKVCINNFCGRCKYCKRTFSLSHFLGFTSFKGFVT